MELSSLLAHHARYRPQAPPWCSTISAWTTAPSTPGSIGLPICCSDWASSGKGERVATLLPNTLELLEIYWACARIGAVTVPLSPLLTGPGLSSLVNDAGAVCLVTQRSLLPVVEAVLPDLATLMPRSACC
jgi:long-chain acyl-CoA synthetase